MSDLADLRKLAPRVPRARQAMLDNLPGYGNGADGPSSGHGDRTLSLALKATMSTDPAVNALARLDRLCPAASTAALEAAALRGERITAQVSELHRILAVWAPTDERRDALRGERHGKGDDGCVSCAKVNDSLGRPVYSERWNGSRLCQRCYRDLRRVRAREKHREAEVVPAVVLRWRQRHPAETRLTEDILDGLLSGRITV